MEPSARYRLSKTDLVKITRGALLVAAGCAVAWLSQKVVPHIEQVSTLDGVVVGIATIVLNTLRKFLADYSHLEG